MTRIDKKSIKRKLGILSLLLICSLYFLILFLKYCGIPGTSDFANLILEGADVFAGNFFRNGWTLSGVSFTATDIPFYTLAVAVLGVSPEAYVLAVTMMLYFAIFAGGLLAVHGLERTADKWIALGLFISLVALPCDYWLDLGRAHIGSMAWAFCGLLFADRYLCDGSRKNAAWTFLFFTLSAWGDSVALLGVILPLMIVLAAKAGTSYDQAKSTAFRAAKSCGIAALAAICGVVLDGLYFVIGTADKNTFLQNVQFSSFNELGSRFSLWLNGLFRIQNADFYGKQLFAPATPLYFLRTLILLGGLLCVVCCIIKFLCGKNTDLIGTVVSIGFCFLSVFFILTNVSIDISAFRYLAYTPIAFAILIVRSLMGWKSGERHLGSQLALGMIPIGLVLFLASVIPFPTMDIAIDPVDIEVISKIEEMGLSIGYADFWNASQLTLLSKGKVRSRAVLGSNGNLVPHMWICKEDWYREPVQFVISDDRWPGFGVSRENIIAFYGEPDQIVDVDSRHIYVYQDGAPCLMTWEEKPVCIEYDVTKGMFCSGYDDAFTSSESPNMLLFGPYQALQPGTYNVSFYFSYNGPIDQETSLGKVDVFSNTAGILKEGDISQDMGLTVGETLHSMTLYNVQIDSRLTDIETRMYANVPGINIQKVSIEAVSEGE